MKRVIVLGSTGSIGRQALEVIAQTTQLTVVGLSCGRDVRLLLDQALALGVRHLAVTDAGPASLCRRLYPEAVVREGEDASARLVREVEADIVLNAIVGFAGLASTLTALERGYDVALANKESLVCGGGLVRAAAAKGGGRLLPVDSEHSAVFQLLAGLERTQVDAIVLTCSGGPFRGWSREELAAVTPEQALAHPTWNMGRKISIDSATLMNKGLELIEAHHLFALPYDRLQVLIHPQSVVHAFVRLVDGALVAHLGSPDMRIPISYALHYPTRKPVAAPPLDLAALGTLSFEEPDGKTFPSLEIARRAGAAGDRSTCAMNAANEVAVQAFLSGRLSFSGVFEVIERVLATAPGGDFSALEEAVAADQEARRAAESEVAKLVRW